MKHIVENRANCISPILDIASRCCGCNACVAICPVNCLQSNADACGFIRIQQIGTCIMCNNCCKVCPVMNKSDESKAISSYWAKAKSTPAVIASSSGGIFSLLAGVTLNDNGVVYGASFSADYKSVSHERITLRRDLPRLMRSKYLQSRLRKSDYLNIENDLLQSRRVLFSGTGCQISALNNYLHMRLAPCDSLTCLEVICHGVPSPGLWASWILYKESCRGEKVRDVNFRDKKTGWQDFSLSYYFGTKVESEPHTKDWFYKAFTYGASIRPSCFDCPSKRCCGSDITVGDFWGIEQVEPSLANSLGVSAFIVNTSKGSSAFQEIESDIDYDTVDYSDILKHNASLEISARPFDCYDEFWESYKKVGSISALMQKWPFRLNMIKRGVQFLNRKLVEFKSQK